MAIAPDFPPVVAQLSELQALCTQVRRDILRMTHAVDSGHPGGSLGCVEYFVALFKEVLHHTPQPFNMDGTGQDLFFLSNGHISPVYYSVLARTGYFPVEELNTFRKLDSRLQGHPATLEGLEGIRVATGSLGQGLSVAIGAALAKRLNHDDRFVYCLIGDGEAQEGQIWEAAQFATYHRVDNLIAAVDLNYKQIDGDTRDVIALDNLAEKFQAFGWHVLDVPDGNALHQVLEHLAAAQKAAKNGKPVVLMLRTVMGKGVDFMEGTHEWHGKAPNDAQLARALAQLPETLGDYPL